MSIRSLIRTQNEWLLTDQLDRLKTAALLLFLGGTTVAGLALLLVGLFG